MRDATLVAMQTRRHHRAHVVTVLAVAIVLFAAVGCSWVDRETGRTVARVLVVGDSVMGQASSAVIAKFQAVGIEARWIGGSGSGPLDGQKRWATLLTQELATYDADVVIFEACCSYPDSSPASAPERYVTTSGIEVFADTELMFTEWEQAERELIQIARDAGASPWWVSLPPGNEVSRFYGPLVPERIARINAMVPTLGVPVLDWQTAVMTHPDVNLLRYGDGVHFTAAGNQFLADFTFSATLRPASA